jgi:hypothetical protein
MLAYRGAGWLPHTMPTLHSVCHLGSTHPTGDRATSVDAIGPSIQGSTFVLTYESLLQILSQDEHDNVFARASTHIAVQADHLNTGDLLDHLVKPRTGALQQMSANLPHQLLTIGVSSKGSFSRCQHASQSNQDQILDDPDPDILGTTAQIFPLELGDALSDLRFHLAFTEGR